MNIRLRYMDGIELEFQDFRVIFDPLKLKEGVDLYLISHAHSDHYPTPKSSYVSFEVYSSPETKDIIAARHGAAGWIREISLGKPILFKDRYQVSVYPSGHMLGSRGFIIDDGNLRIAYTGDLNNRPSLSTLHDAVVPEDIDILIVEATYGHPNFRFGNPQQIWMQMIRWAASTVEYGKLACFKGYTAGKSQEIEAIFGLLTNIPILPHPSVYRVNRVYEKYGVSRVTRNLVSDVKEAKLIVSPIQLKSWAGRKVLTASATGRILIDGEFGFPLSSHADYPSLLKYIVSCRPKRVYTVFGYPESLSYAVNKKLKIPAKPLTEQFSKIVL